MAISSLTDVPIDGVPIHKRNIGMVFQHYALFPHLSVFENVAYGLRERRVPQAEMRERVMQMVEMVGLAGLDSRRPRELSGGQQQRVALARALVINPALLLLDEPLSNLDTKLRERVRGEIRELQQRLGITTVFVTHDQDEALSIAHTVVVMRAGRIEQAGTPLEIYQRPVNAFVADFLGACNLVSARVESVDHGQASCRLASGALVTLSDPHVAAGDLVTLAVRPERLTLLPASPLPVAGADGAVDGTVRGVTYLGPRTSYDVDAGGVPMRCDVLNTAPPYDVGSRVCLSWEPDSWQAFR